MAKLKPSEQLQTLVNRAAFLSTEVQIRFGGLVGDSPWEVDFGAEHPALAFEAVGSDGEDGTLTLSANLAGSLAEGEGTWHWAWDNINEFPQAVVARAADVLALGESEHVPELTATEVKADSDQAQRLILAAKLATGIWAHYPAETGPKTAAWLLVDGTELALPAPSIRPVVTAMAASLQQLEITDHRAALESYARLRGFATIESDDGGVRILTADGSAEVTFDEQRRLTNCQVHAPLEGEAAAQFAASGTIVPQASVGTAQVSPVPQVGSEPAPASESTSAPAPAETPAAATSSTEAAAPAATRDTPESTPAGATPSSAGPTTADSAQSPEAEDAPEPSPADESPSPEESGAQAEDQPKKKGFFKKLFGR